MPNEFSAPGVLPQSYHPEPRSSAPVIHNIMYLEGEPIHRSIVKAEYRATEHSRQAPAFDGHRTYAGADGQMWDL